MTIDKFKKWWPNWRWPKSSTAEGRQAWMEEFHKNRLSSHIGYIALFAEAEKYNGYNKSEIQD